jgi:hypothetical protein
MAIDEHWIAPKKPPTQRVSSKVFAKGSAKNTTHIVAMPDGSYVVAHHEGFAASPGGITHRNADGSIRAAQTGVFGPFDASRSTWLAAGPHHEGENASMCLVNAATLDVLETLPLVRPFRWLSETSLLAHTPKPNIAIDKKTYATTRLPGYRANPALLAQLALPETPGLVSFDLVTRQARLLCEAELLDEFTCAVPSPDQRVIYAATRGRRIVALRREDGATLWELPSLRDSFRFSLLALALSPDGTQLVCAGSGLPHDCVVLDAATGTVRAEYALRQAVDDTRALRKRSHHLTALAFHDEGHLVLGTNSGAIVVVRRDGSISAFKASASGVGALAFSVSGRELISGSHEDCLRVWPFEV